MSQAVCDAATPAVNHRDLSPVMIVGHGSSGTSITGKLIREYLRVSFGTESQFIPRYYYRLQRYGDLDNDANLRRLIADVLNERWFIRSRKFGFQTDLEDVFAGIKERSYRGVLDSIFRQLAVHNRMVRWGDKSPEYIHHLPVLKAVFPDARYIHLVRDGRDVALSVFDRFWGAKNLVTAALEWRDAVESGRTFLNTLQSDQFIELRYEDLLTQPRETFAKIIAFLNVEDGDGRLIEHIVRQAERELKSNNFNKWKTALTTKQQQAFDRVNGDLLALYGYETTTTEARQPGALERMFWSADSRVRQWGSLDYWKDDLYKADLRIKEALRSLGFSPGRDRVSTPRNRDVGAGI